MIKIYIRSFEEEIMQTFLQFLVIGTQLFLDIIESKMEICHKGDGNIEKITLKEKGIMTEIVFAFSIEKGFLFEDPVITVDDSQESSRYSPLKEIWNNFFGHGGKLLKEFTEYIFQ
jgi:hypothetical protein